MAKPRQKPYASWRTWLTAVMLVLLVVTIIWKWPDIAKSLDTIKQMPLTSVLVMVGVFVLTIISAAFSYYCLALHPVRFSEANLVELAASGVNRVLPAGTGSIGIHALFLTRRGHSAAEAAAVVSVNNVIGFAEHMILLGLLVLFARVPATDNGNVSVPSFAWWILLGMVLVMAVSSAFPKIRRAVLGFWHHFVISLKQYKTRPKHLVLAYLAAVGVTLTNFIIFLVAAHAFDIHIGITALFVAFTLGVLVGATLPTPGGLGGVEAGLVAGLLAKGVDPTSALAAAIAFRLITYWLPLLVGTPAFFVARARKLV